MRVYNRPGQTVDRQQFGGRSQIFLIQKKLSKLKGVIIAIHKLVQTLLENVVNCVLKPIIGKIFSKKTLQPQNSKKIILNELFCNFFIR